MFKLIIATVSALPLLVLGAPLLATTGSQTSMMKRQDPEAVFVQYDTCDMQGSVSSVSVSPCRDGDGSFGSPCIFYEGETYAITLTYTPWESATLPRADLIAWDDTWTYGSDHYPYSGQSFDGCKYTPCAIEAGVEATYTYNLRTLNSQFNALTFNMTQSLVGPSLMCAGFPINFVPKDDC